MDNELPHNLPYEEGVEEKEIQNSPTSTDLSFDSFDGNTDDAILTKDTATPKTEQENSRLTDIGTKALAVVGLLSILTLGGFGAVKVVQVAPGALFAAVSSITSNFVPAGSDGDIVFIVESHNINAGEEMTLAWSHDTNREGTYFFRYDCVAGVTAEAPDTNGDKKEVMCDAPFKFENINNTLLLTFLSIENRFSDVPVHLTFFPEGGEKSTVQGTTLLTVIDTGISTRTATSARTERTGVPTSGGERRSDFQIINGSEGGSTSGSLSNPNGIPDLQVTILATGIVDKVTNSFTPGSTVGQNDRAGISFQIKNIGTKASGTWKFIVDLPLAGNTLYVYRPTEIQRSLNPGERIEYTLGFDGIDRSNTTVTAVINVDTERTVSETDVSNNSASAVILIEQK